MVSLIQSPLKYKAWEVACNRLMNMPRMEGHFVLEIENPCSKETTGLTAALIDRWLKSQEQPGMTPRSEGIFPNKEYQEEGLKGVFVTYPTQTYPHLKSNPPDSEIYMGPWGTYAIRLLEPYKGSEYCPLEDVITKLQVEMKTRHPKKTGYEINLFDMPVYDVEHDNQYHRGGPCLVHLSFQLHKGVLHLTALYRNHDYCYTLPGNLLGLANLLACVAKETGTSPGRLVIHSTHAYIKGNKSGLKDFFSWAS